MPETPSKQNVEYVYVVMRIPVTPEHSAGRVGALVEEAATTLRSDRTQLLGYDPTKEVHVSLFGDTDFEDDETDSCL